ncbi:MAG TPA: hypothetical protein VLV86_16435 [Vicinamibacterales bacterium]|nr:hypothetical protein [Vicinamibacterales bacterium]
MKLAALIAVGMAVALAVSLTGQAPPPRPSAASATQPKPYASPKTPWGDPDLQGVWNDATSTPLQRPNGLKDVLTDEEAADFQSSLAHDLTRDRRDGGADADVNRAYNDHWMDARRLKITADKRTSLIVDPPDGRIPPLVPLSPERQAVRSSRAGANQRFNAGLPDDYTDMSLPVRCIIRTDSPPYLPTIYNNNFQIVQSPGVVAIAPEMIHSTRMVYTDGRPHLDRGISQWLGDSRGHWDGATLVVETTNFRSDDGVVFQGANPATFKITEQFTRVGPTSINYEFTIQDPATWTKPWTALIPWNKVDPEEQMFEYGCHEDNFDIVHFLKGARSRQKNAR